MIKLDYRRGTADSHPSERETERRCLASPGSGVCSRVKCVYLRALARELLYLHLKMDQARMRINVDRWDVERGSTQPQVDIIKVGTWIT